MNYKELKNVITTKKIDFIAYVLTPFHYVGVLAFLIREYEKRNEKICGVILVGQNRATCIDTSLRLPEFVDAIVDYWENDNDSNIDIKKIMVSHSDKSNQINIVYPDTVWLRMWTFLKQNEKGNVKNIIVDDGTMSFMSRYKKAATVSEDKMSFIQKFIKSSFTDFVIGLNKENVEYFSIFLSNNFLDEKYLTYYKSAFEFLSSKSLSMVLNGKYIVYLGTFFRKESERLAIESQVSDMIKMFERKGIKIFIKEHPRQKIRNVDKKHLLPQDILIESLIAGAPDKPCAIVGHASTALITIASMWGIKCYSLDNNNSFIEMRNKSNILRECIELITQGELSNIEKIMNK